MTFRTSTVISLAALTLMSLTASSMPSQAQDQKLSRMQSEPDGGLSPDQRAKAGTREAKFQKDVAALRADTTLTNPQKQEKYKTLYQAMDSDMLAILTPAQRAQVTRQRQINIQFQKDAAALQADPKLTDAQKKARYQQLVQKARDVSLANMTPAQRAATLKRVAAAQQQRQQQLIRLTEARRLSKQLQNSETPAQSKKISDIALANGAKIQDVVASKTLSDVVKTQRINELRKATEATSLAILTPAQRALYARIQALLPVPR